MGKQISIVISSIMLIANFTCFVFAVILLDSAWLSMFNLTASLIIAMSLSKDLFDVDYI